MNADRQFNYQFAHALNSLSSFLLYICGLKQKSMRSFFLSILLIFTFIAVHAQDELKVMQYNLLNYGNFTDYCTAANNNIVTKNGYLTTIFDYVKPDILTVNEMAENSTYHEYLLSATLNVNGETAYKRALMAPEAQGDWLVNMLYYNSKKLTLHKHDVINTIIRTTDVYTLFYNAADLAQTHDTAFISCIVTHLKAGSTATDAADRALMTGTVMNYIQSHDLKNNYLFMGDFNVYTSTELAYQNLIKSYNGLYYLYDPIASAGAWNNNSIFSSIHSQSTHTENNGCASTGGMDDRFDQILSSADLMNGTHGMQLLPETYKSLGNDGLHFNLSIIAAPTNTSVPADVLNALYNNSDHLPIVVQIRTDQSYLQIEENASMDEIKFQNPVQQQLNVSLSFSNATTFELRIYDLTGRIQKLVSGLPKSKLHQLSIPVSELKKGIYFLQLRKEDGTETTSKFIKQ
ncbi:MAG TPA: hypothetical protein DCG69_01125 [Bacteroidales bacterium]|nr:hypothetical protein [Bacteroidales bacterium]